MAVQVLDFAWFGYRVFREVRVSDFACRVEKERRAEHTFLVLFMCKRAQQVTCRIAFVASGCCFSSSIAPAVGSTTNSILRRSASRLT